MHLFGIDTLKLNLAHVAKRLRVFDRQHVNRLVKLAGGVIAAQGAYRACFVEDKGETGVTIEGVHLRSRVLRDHLNAVGRVFPFVMTAGAAVDALMEETTDLLDKYILGEIANHAMRETRRAFESHLCARFALEKISSMTPGSLEDWPIEGQRDLFALLPGVEASIGVRLTDNLLMLPRRSVAGLYFPTEATFVNCQICPRRLCDDRKAPYVEEKARV
ncbi:MAG: hypothetical protein C4519_28355 [Desulfobacteraceae bacterium]|nr:MAG: hypothetical protein C4519_28355 [Desulfobacteraceae bacterium]